MCVCMYVYPIDRYICSVPYCIDRYVCVPTVGLYVPNIYLAGCEVLYVDGGHISTTILKQKTFQ